MFLSLASWSFPLLTLPEAAAVSRAIGIGALDLSTRKRAALPRAALLDDPRGVAGQVTDLGVRVPNYFHHFGPEGSERPLSLPGTVDANARELEQALTFADAAEIATVFVVPGGINPGQSRQQAMNAAAQSIAILQEVAQGFRAELCIEPTVHSWAESPEIVLQLVEMTGIRLVLDYSHFICLGHTQEALAPLVRHAAHVHLRQARMGLLQTRFSRGSINFPALFADLRQVGYAGALTIECLHTDLMDAHTEDVMTETVALRDCFNTWMGLPARQMTALPT